MSERERGGGDQMRNQVAQPVSKALQTCEWIVVEPGQRQQLLDELPVQAEAVVDDDPPAHAVVVAHEHEQHRTWGVTSQARY